MGNDPDFDGVPLAVVIDKGDEFALVRDVLGDVTGEAWAIASALPVAAFAEPTLRKIWTALKAGVEIDDAAAIVTAARISPAQWVELSSDFVSTARTSLYVAAVRESYVKRRTLEIAAAMAEGRGSPAAFIEQLSELSEPSFGRKIEGRGLFDFKPVKKDDHSVLLGNRFLNRGDGMIISSTSGMGKSSLLIQALICWALGFPFQGIPSNGPLKTVVAQSEDGDGDIAEVVASVAHAMALTPAQRAKVNSQIIVYTDRVNRGLKFIAELKKRIAKHSPDLVAINPLMGFLDGDINDARDAGAFLREGLNGLNEPARFGYVIVHHTTKPPKEKTARNWNEVMYDMAGSADLTNWARAIISLRASDVQGDFNLVLAKRGKRAGVTKEVPQGTGWRIEAQTTIPLAHSNEAITLENGETIPLIYWKSREEDKNLPSTSNPQGAGRKRKFAIADYIDAVPVGIKSAQSLAEIHRVTKAGFSDINKSSLSDLLSAAVAEGLVTKLANGQKPLYYRI